MKNKLKHIALANLDTSTAPPLEEQAIADARKIIADVRAEGEAALRRYGERFGDIEKGAPLFIERDQLQQALNTLPAAQRDLLKRTAERIRRFAEAQRSCISPLSFRVEGGQAGHTVEPVEVAACYAPGGRYPLPSSMLMTCVTARVAGVQTIIAASPKPAQLTLAAAAAAGADRLLAVGGAQAIAALAYGLAGAPRCDIIVGPGNKWVTAAKHLVSSVCAIDMLAGPSELVVIADESAHAGVIAADLLGQAEHDVVARPILITTSKKLADAVDVELERQLRDLPTAATAREAIGQGFTLIVASMNEAIDASNRIAPEHVQVITKDANGIAKQLRNYGALFIGPASAEVFGDYGVGPNHVLPTGGTARASGGLSVFTFLRVRTWLEMDSNALGPIIEDAAALGRLEGLEGHARAAEMRKR
ncbi:MAG: histidinol dehydrogenase [Planctomycetes bacterium]|nr:histidinol dehydrogenase [Planctomycetota bacterium]